MLIHLLICRMLWWWQRQRTLCNRGTGKLCSSRSRATSRNCPKATVAGAAAQSAQKAQCSQRSKPSQKRTDKQAGLHQSHHRHCAGRGVPTCCVCMAVSGSCPPGASTRCSLVEVTRQATRVSKHASCECAASKQWTHMQAGLGAADHDDPPQICQQRTGMKAHPA